MLSFLVTTCLIVGLKAYTCDPDAYDGCEGEDLDTTGDLTCGGLEGCEDADISVGGKLYCFGQDGCTDATLESASQVRAWGYFSAQRLTTSSGSISNRMLCNGLLACELATIYSDIALLSMGGGSTWGATAYASGGSESSYLGRFYGYWAAMNATLVSNGIDTYTLHFYGYQSGANADIYCSDDTDNCDIVCLNSSCSSDMTVYNEGAVSTTLDCEDLDECPTYVDLTENKQAKVTFKQSGVIIPIGEIPERGVDLSDRFEGEAFHAYKKYKLDKKAAIDDKKRKLANIQKYDTITVGERNECYATDSCSDQTISSTTSDETELQCDGYNSCDDDTILVTSGDFDCSGYDSCSDSVFDISGDDSVLDCGGYNSCAGLYTSSMAEIYMSGWYTCVGCEFDAPGNITVWGSKAFTDATLRFNYADQYRTIDAYGLVSFNQATIYVSQDSALEANFYGYSAGYYVTIEVASGSTLTVTCNYYACYGAQIVYVDSGSVEVECLSSDSDYCPTLTQDTSAAMSKREKASISKKTLRLREKATLFKNQVGKFRIDILALVAVVLAVGTLMVGTIIYKCEEKDIIKGTEYQALLNH